MLALISDPPKEQYCIMYYEELFDAIVMSGEMGTLDKSALYEEALRRLGGTYERWRC
jgi:FMN phosphatase YigB (HAD superfamily)